MTGAECASRGAGGCAIEALPVQLGSMPSMLISIRLLCAPESTDRSGGALPLNETGDAGEDVTADTGSPQLTPRKGAPAFRSLRVEFAVDEPSERSECCGGAGVSTTATLASGRGELSPTALSLAERLHAGAARP